MSDWACRIVTELTHYVDSSDIDELFQSEFGVDLNFSGIFLLSDSAAVVDVRDFPDYTVDKELAESLLAGEDLPPGDYLEDLQFFHTGMYVLVKQGKMPAGGYVIEAD